MYHSNKHKYNSIQLYISNQVAGAEQRKNRGINKNNKNSTKMTDNKIKEIYQELIQGQEQICQGHEHQIDINEIKSQMFNVILVLVGARGGMLYEIYQSYPILIEINEKIIELIKNILMTHNLDNIEIDNIFRPHYLIYDNKYKDQALLLEAQDDVKVLGKLLDYTCPGDNLDKMNDRITQLIYAYDYPFFTQMCTMENYQRNEKKFKSQLKKYQKIGKLLDVDVRMTFRKFTGARTLVSKIHKNGAQGIIEYKDELINILTQGSDEKSVICRV